MRMSDWSSDVCSSDLDRVEFGAFGRQGDDADIVGNVELASHVPARLIHQHDRVSTGGDGERYLGEMQRHGFGIAERQHQPCAFALLRADRTKDIGRFGPLIFRRRWRSEEHTSELQSLMRISYAGFCW